MDLLNLIDESCVKVNLESPSKEECLEEMIEVLINAGRISNRTEALNAVRRREADGTTGIGRGLAVPHGQSPSFGGTAVAIGISKRGVDFDAPDGEPVQAVIMILGARSEPGLFIQILAEVSRLFRIEGFARKLATAADARQILDMLGNS